MEQKLVLLILSMLLEILVHIWNFCHKSLSESFSLKESWDSQREFQREEGPRGKIVKCTSQLILYKDHNQIWPS